MELESILLPGIDPKRPLVISGPCSAETEEQVMSTAKELKKAGIKIFIPSLSDIFSIYSFSKYLLL